MANEYRIRREFIEQFFWSMEMDLHKTTYNATEIKDYITGSAEAVGLMCLQVFCEGNESLFTSLSGYAQSLGAAFQKVNFLRDLNTDFHGLGRTYLPAFESGKCGRCSKADIEEDIKKDFANALLGIKKLPRTSRLGVYVAYVYYRSLFRKIAKTPAESFLNRRIRIANGDKARLLAYSYVRHQLNLI
jgi:phytoene/squalene synthetase